jgi:hypothetical protein
VFQLSLQICEVEGPEDDELWVLFNAMLDPQAI